MTTPEPSVWPKTFQQDFFESVEYPTDMGNKHFNTGVYYYDVSDENNMLTRLDRDNGRWDRYCGVTHHLKNQPCRHYIEGKDGDRYLYYPDSDTCCYCCSGNAGCGVMRYDWMSDGTYEGEEQMNGESTFKWNKQGLQDNFYWETN